MIELKIDLFRELELCCDFRYQIVVPEEVVSELNKIQLEQRGKFKRAAKLVLDIIKAKKLPLVKTEQKFLSVDDLLVDYSQHSSLVLTQDVILKKRLMKPYLTIRQKRRIMVIN